MSVYDEAKQHNINLDANKPLITGNVTKSVTVQQRFIGRTFTGNVDDFINSLNQEKMDNEEDSASSSFSNGM